MKYDGNKVSDIKIAYIGGGSKGWAWGLMSDLALEAQLSGTVSLFDINYEAALNNEIIGNKVSASEDAKGKWKYQAVKGIDQALTGADFVVISILPGTLNEMKSDVHEPEKYGIYQAVGDTVGPAGLVRSLRTVPMYVEIAENIKKYSPDAWVINYTNPMAMCVQVLYEVFPEIKAFGCCHEVFGTQELLAEMLNNMLGIKDVKREDIKVNVLGLNHFTWLDSASYQGMDLFPLYKQFVDKYYEEGFAEKVNKEHATHTFFHSGSRVKFDLFKKYGLIAAAGDRHLSEFMPPWYLKDPETVKGWKFGLTPASWRFEHLKKLQEKSSRLTSGEQEFSVTETGEEGVKQIKALLGLQDLFTNVNLPNQGQIKGIPLGVVVESNAMFTRDNVRPIIAGQLPSDIHSLVMRHVLNRDSILKAALNKDKELAFRAFVNDPLVNIDIHDARELFETMLSNTKKFLPGWDI